MLGQTEQSRNAIKLRNGGEQYQYDASAGECPLCWVNRLARSKRTDSISSAVCEIPANYNPGETFTVSIIITPASDVVAYAVEDQTPEGWAISSISDAGSFDAVNNKVKYGPFFDNQARTLTYQITPPITASGSYTFLGNASFDGADVQITGDRSLSNGGTMEAIPGDANQDGKLDLQDVIYILQILTDIRNTYRP